MTNILNIILILSTNVYIYSVGSNEEKLYNHSSLEQNLYFVFSTFRHGARSPFSKNDYFGNNISYPGALSKYGAIQHLEIGKKYRQRYSNFLNMSFDKNQMHIRSSDIERTIVSTLKELEGLFGKAIGRSNIHIIKNGNNYWNLFQLNDSEHKELDKYFQYCNKKRFLQYYGNILRNDIFPFLKECYGKSNVPELGNFCDSVFTAYFEYIYNNDTENKIGKCGKDKADKMHQFCYDCYNTFKGWNENAAYMFYIFFQNIFKYMMNFIRGKSDLRMIMVGGHDVTVDKLMNFLDGLNIIPRSIFPHYAFNIVIELRKYKDDFFIEFYYNDILKYNDTLITFDNILKNSKFSDLYNFCGVPPWFKDTIKETEQIKNENTQEISFTQIPDDKKEKEKIDITIHTQIENKEYLSSSTEKIKIKEPILQTSELEDSMKIKIIEKIYYTQNITEENEKNNINNSLIIDVHKSKQANATTSGKFKTKLKKIFKQDGDIKIYIILLLIIVSIIIIFFVILIICVSQRRKKFIVLNEEKSKNKININDNLNIISVDIKKDEKK